MTFRRRLAIGDLFLGSYQALVVTPYLASAFLLGRRDPFRNRVTNKRRVGLLQRLMVFQNVLYVALAVAFWRNKIFLMES